MLAHGIIVNRKSICVCIEMMQMNHKSIYLCLCMFSIEVFFFVIAIYWKFALTFDRTFPITIPLLKTNCHPNLLFIGMHGIFSRIDSQSFFSFFDRIRRNKLLNTYHIWMLYFVLKGMSKPFNNIKFSPHEWEAHRWNLNMLWLVSLFHLYHSIRELIQWIHFVESVTCRSIDSLKFEIHSIVSNCKINFRIAIFNAGVWILNFEYWAMLLQLITFRTLGNGLICKYCMLVHCYPGI